MASNLGPYKDITEKLKRDYNGDLDAFYGDIQDSGAKKAATKQRLEGGLIASVILFAVHWLKKHFTQKKEKEALKESELQKDYKELVNQAEKAKGHSVQYECTDSSENDLSLFNDNDDNADWSSQLPAYYEQSEEPPVPYPKRHDDDDEDDGDDEWEDEWEDESSDDDASK